MNFNGISKKIGRVTFRLPGMLVLLAALLGGAGCKSLVSSNDHQFSRFIGVDDFSVLDGARNDGGDLVWLTPEIDPQVSWDQLIISWNADAPPGTFVKVEAAAIASGFATKFYTLGHWSLDGIKFPRTSMRGQKDADGTVNTDTLVLNQPADMLQVRITLGGTNHATPALKFLGFNFSNTRVPPAAHSFNHSAWGKLVAVPEHTQHGYQNGTGWCSPASLSMVLSYWSQILKRPELDLTVPQVANAVYDKDFAGTGNWPFNTAFAGSFPGMRSYVTRLDDLSEVETWIAAGIPVILSTRWDLLEPGRPADTDGHLIVCIGFTKEGDVVVNDPATHLDRGETVRRVYQRDNVIRAWAKSHNTVYLVYPENVKIPRDDFGHW